MKARRGSALLVVLGMVAFMIVSAVAFSAYMRYSRLPSSYLRRATASRQLVKAALARAINTIDKSIGDDPHPNVGVNQSNIWKDRVFIGSNQLLSDASTPPTLTLEGLAYIPAPLVNAARYYSRKSKAAVWEQFSFDAGRYAFCAIDVSDYLDVNRVCAHHPRSSSDHSRVSLAHIFENAQHTSMDDAALEKWDSWSDKFKPEEEDDGSVGSWGGKVPIVSLADMNLSLWQEGMKDYVSPVISVINTKNANNLDEPGSESALAREKLSRLTFVTDSYLPTTQNTNTTEVLDLSQDEGQPFAFEMLNKKDGGTSVMDILSNGSKGGVELQKTHLSTAALMCLADYLDIDRVPISLAAPTIERSPLFCGVKPNVSGTFALRPPEEGAVSLDIAGTSIAEPNVKTGDSRDVYQKVKYYLDGAQLVAALVQGVEAMVIYPFSSPDIKGAQSYTIDGRLLMFFTEDGKTVGTRTNNDNDALHLKNKDLSASTTISTDGVLSIPLTAVQKTFGGKAVNDEKDVIEKIQLTAQGIMSSAGQLNQQLFLEVTYQWTQQWNSSMGSYSNTARPQGNGAVIVDGIYGMPPLTENASKGAEKIDLTALQGDGLKLRLNAALYLRVSDKDGKTLDLVPAHMKDDNLFNQVANNVPSQITDPICGNAYPVMRFDLGDVITINSTTLPTLTSEMTPSPKVVYIDDPRFNHAPESWYYDANANALSEEDWLNGNHSAEHNGDIFLSTSDQGYLQSIYELAFLPRLSDGLFLATGSGSQFAGLLQQPIKRNGFGVHHDALNHDLAWQTYKLFGDNADEFDELPFANLGHGMRINPYSDSTNVLMSALANTPLSWAYASTNNQEIAFEEMEASEFNESYAWNEYNSNGQMAWLDLQKFAGSFMNRIDSNRFTSSPEQLRSPSSNKHWQDAWQEIWRDFGNDDSLFFENSPIPLRSVDKKFLYGFWRECFDVRQQLFLIFVRAEPMMMGAGTNNKVPPQLGARAVALVWRDPNAAENSSAQNTGNQGSSYIPHRTRVLFYKPLD